MSIKVHFLLSRLAKFPDNCRDVSDEQEERFHQVIKAMEERYQGRLGKWMMADNCRNIKRDRQSRKRKFFTIVLMFRKVLFLTFIK